jgi:starch synthase
MKNLQRNSDKKLNILIVSSEMYPYAKIGGLADVVASLSGALKKTGHDVRVVIPRYAMIDKESLNAQKVVEPMGVWMGNKEEWCTVYQITSNSEVPVYLIEHQLYFDRWGLYHDSSMHDYDDNPLRFSFLSRAALQLCKDIQFKPDVVHANDWQTALTPAYLKVWHWNDPLLGSAASMLTIHNIAYQGIYPKKHMEYIGLGWHNFTEDKLESYDQINFLKGGIHYADVITAVSPTFAKEITAPYGGFGLSPYLASKTDSLMGIINGIDYAVWSPQNDQLIPANFSIQDLSGKKICKKKLQNTFDLAEDDHVAVIGAIGRFVEQKGFHLLAQTIESLIQNMHVQFVILGTGDRNLEEFFGNLPARYSGKAGSYIGFDNYRAHLITAGCDFFLMPSLFEPCGLNQMYSQHYGTLPIVRATGGLDDTVENYDESSGNGSGFKFWEPTSHALYYTVGWAISTYYDRPHHMKMMIQKAMSKDFSWESSASHYVEAYHKAIENKKRLDGEYKPYYW